MEILDEKEKIRTEILAVEKELLQEDAEGTDHYYDKLEVLKYGLEQNFDFDFAHIPEYIIELFVDEIRVVDNETFIWKLKFDGFDKVAYIKGNARKHDVSLKGDIKADKANPSSNASKLHRQQLHRNNQ